MESYPFDDKTITINKKGASSFSKVSYPIRYGRFSEIKTKDYIYQFNLNGEIKFIQGKNQHWPDPNEWLKRTISNDWIYYSAGGYQGIYSFIGEYYLPYFKYPCNTIFRNNPFGNGRVESAIHSLDVLLSSLEHISVQKAPPAILEFAAMAAKNRLSTLDENSDTLHAIIGGSVTVLPPDTRHVDYEVIPVTIADGCMYNCGFCSVKQSKKFSRRSKKNILEQINRLKDFYKKDLSNYNSIFLGQHDALHAGIEFIEFAALQSYEILDIKNSNIKEPRLFLFGSVDSLIQTEESAFTALNKTPFYTYINIGLESADQKTLDRLKKPISIQKVQKAFFKMIDLNKKFENIEISANFILGQNLSDQHYDSILSLTRDSLDRFYSKGNIYLSPMNPETNKKEIQEKFTALKNQSRLPTHVYLIQRL
ncbi:MAG: radical SAM protein [Deltaproteobacteria bacterium]|nr:radical SAM protein [Deltaproteobacteria bacterium]